VKFLFYKPIITQTKYDDNICFWSDTHFGHRCDHWPVPLWQMRGFTSVEEHDATLIERWNNKTTEHTIAFHLGDFIFGYSAAERFKVIIERLNFNALYLMPGNHHSGWRTTFEETHGNIWDVAENKKVIFIPNYVEIVANGQPIVASHYPLASFNGQAKGSWMLHGHCHGNLHESEIGSLIYKTKTLDIGIEKAPTPLTLTELHSIFDARNNFTYDVAARV
jgi:calcineurin-like phosphoesterase family protein